MNDETTRDRIVSFVRENPGAAKVDVCQGLNVGWGTATHHLYRLERDGLVVVRRHRGRAALFSREVPELYQEWLATLRDDGTRRLLGHLEGAGEVSLGELVQETSLTRRVVARHLGLLSEAGLIEKRGHHRPVYRALGPLKELLGTMRRTWRR